MNIEPIELKLVSMRHVHWLWGVNALWFVAIAGCLVWWQWRENATAAQEAIVSARTLAFAASAALLIGQEKGERKARAMQPLKRAQPFNWDEVLKALEDTQVNGVSVESFRIDGAKNEVNVVLAFKSYARVGEYEEELNARVRSLQCGVLTAELREDADASGRAALACFGR